LLRATCDELWLVDGGVAKPFDGDLDDYANWLAQQRSAERAGTSNTVSDKAPPRQQQDRVADEALKKSALAARRQAEKEIANLDKQLAGWQGELKLIEQRLADPDLYAQTNAAQAPGLHQRQGELAKQIAQSEERWIALQEQLERC
jgi:ATP-binding cassette subfamily F protein 3